MSIHTFQSVRHKIENTFLLFLNEEVTKMGGKTYIELEIYHKCLDES